MEHNNFRDFRKVTVNHTINHRPDNFGAHNVKRHIKMATHKRLRPIRTNHKARLNTLTIAEMS
ncbi:Uncharacterised protein [Vibrio cholerae]|nr:Uncharacterised protein [Vibrio cholerae]